MTDFSELEKRLLADPALVARIQAELADEETVEVDRNHPQYTRGEIVEHVTDDDLYREYVMFVGEFDGQAVIRDPNGHRRIVHFYSINHIPKVTDDR